MIIPKPLELSTIQALSEVQPPLSRMKLKRKYWIHLILRFYLSMVGEMLGRPASNFGPQNTQNETNMGVLGHI